MELTSVLIFLFICFLNIFYHNNFVYADRLCSHYKLKKTRKNKLRQGKKYISAEYDKLDDWQPIRILADYSDLKSNSPVSQKLVDSIKNKIIPKTITVFQQLLKVRRIKKIIFNEKSCNNEIAIQNNNYGPNNPIQADLLILVNFDKTDEFKKFRVEASALHCFQDEKTKRPLVGLITFRDDLEINTKIDVDYLVWLTLHEISHVLVFHEELYADFIDPNTLNPLGLKNIVKSSKNEFDQKVDYIITKNVLEKAKKHYNCDTLEGVPLEFNGGQSAVGGHWSRKAMNTDYMIGRSHGENLISEITLALFEDSGWYKIEYDKANMFHWGKNKGCDFFSKNCVKSSTILNSLTRVFEKNTLQGEKFLKKLRIIETTKEAGKLSFTSIIMNVETNYKKEYCEKLNQPTCSTHNMFRGYCGARLFNAILPKHEQNFSNARIGGFDNFVNRCPIVVENKFSQKFYGGSCRYGSKEDLLPYEKVCKNCGCFVSSLNKNQMQNKTDTEGMTNEESTSFDLNLYSNPIELNSRAACIEFQCKEGEIYVKIDEQKYKCPSEEDLTIKGYNGKIKCPNKNVMCDQKYLCKFGCTKINK